jgi:glycosyltransferase 2 family protein
VTPRSVHLTAARIGPEPDDAPTRGGFPRHGWAVLRWGAIAAVVGALGWRLGAGGLAAGVVGGLRAIDAGSVLAALVIGLVTTLCNAGRWCLVARRLGMRISLPAAVADCYQAQFLNSVLPAGVLGDVHRAVQSGREAGDVGRGARAVVLERTAGLLVLVVVAVAVLIAQPTLLQVAAGLVPVGGWWLAAGLLPAAGVVGWALRSRLRPALGTAAADLRAMLRADTWPGVLALSVVALAGYLAMFVIAARSGGATAPVAELLPLLVLALLVMSLPITVGGWGPREAVAAVGFGAVGLGAEQGLAAAVGFGVLGMVACLPGALVLLGRAVAGRVTRGGAVRDTRRTTAPGSPADPVLFVPTQATADRPRPTPCTPADLGSADAADRPPASPPVRNAA